MHGFSLTPVFPEAINARRDLYLTKRRSGQLKSPPRGVRRDLPTARTHVAMQRKRDSRSR